MPFRTQLPVLLSAANLSFPETNSKPNLQRLLSKVGATKFLNDNTHREFLTFAQASHHPPFVVLHSSNSQPRGFAFATKGQIEPDRLLCLTITASQAQKLLLLHSLEQRVVGWLFHKYCAEAGRSESSGLMTPARLSLVRHDAHLDLFAVDQEPRMSLDEWLAFQRTEQVSCRIFA